MKTRIYKSEDLNQIDVQDDIKKTLLSGRNVIFPTETVYGIGAYALSEEGIKNIYQVKGRPSDNPLIMHISHKEDVFKYTKNHQEYVEKLINQFWPGPLTLVLSKKENVPYIITGGLETVGVRMPNHPIALKVIDIAGVPICAPSANISGKPSSTLFEHVLEDFNNKVDIMIDGGKSNVGIESTVLDVTSLVPVILRPGMITKEMLETVVPKVIGVKLNTSDEIPKAPGMKYRHYAPKGDLVVVDGDIDQVISYITKKINATDSKNQIGVICTTNFKEAFKGAFVYSIGEPNQEEEIASNLFAALRAMDKANIETIYAIAFHEGKYKDALMNRLMKAANQQIIKL
jgi:L-threonylcarbamoyladenylate synthase